MYKITLLILYILFFYMNVHAEANRPYWVNREWNDTSTTLYFSSFVDDLATYNEARQFVLNNVNISVANYSIVFIRSSFTERTQVFQTTTGNIVSANYITIINFETESHSEIILSGLRVEVFVEPYRNSRNQQRYRAWALASVSRKNADRAASEFASRISESYANLLSTRGSLFDVIWAYGNLLNTLANNPLHRAVAYYRIYGRKVSLYEYVNQRLSALISSVSFASIPLVTIQKTDIIGLSATVVSGNIRELGPIRGIARVYRTNNPAPVMVHNMVGVDNAFPLSINTQRLLPGRYNVRLELLFNEISSFVPRNPEGFFSFEVLPAGVEVIFSGSTLSINERSTLLNTLQQGIQRNRIPAILNSTHRGAQNHYSIEIFVNNLEQKPLAFTTEQVYSSDVTIAFFRNGSLLRQTETQRIVGIDRRELIDLIGSFIQNNNSFFSALNDILH